MAIKQQIARMRDLTDCNHKGCMECKRVNSVKYILRLSGLTDIQTMHACPLVAHFELDATGN